ncbi:MAG: erythromycin esterase family protein, partial [Flammeovirgaceae bacterium]
MKTIQTFGSHASNPVINMFFKVFCLVTVFLAMAFSCNKRNDPGPSAKEVFETLNSQGFGNLTFPVTSLTPSASTDDLTFLNTFLSEKPIVALGESTHGTSEFFTFRHRMIQHMVQQLNFRVIAVETNFSTAQNINEYILGGPGTGKAAVQTISGWVYNNQEFVQLIEWLRLYNSAQPAANKVTFHGFDAQSAQAAAKRVQGYLSANDPTYLGSFNATAEPFLNDFDELSKYSLKQLESLIQGFVTNYRTRWNTVST